MSKMIRIAPDVDAKIDRISTTLNMSKKDIVKRAIEKLDRELTLKQISNEYAELRKDKKAWNRALSERLLWEASDEWDFDDK